VADEDITIPVPLASAHPDDMLRYIIETQAQQHKEMKIYMATIDEDLDRLFQGITNEIQQVRDELQGQITDLGTENADLTERLQAADDSLAAVQQRIEGKTAELEANDPPTA
jgi:septal ring factor EnvC (AmiA/AmiB activator)